MAKTLLGHAAASSIDPEMRKGIERYHSQDAALYQQAPEIRDRHLESLSIVNGKAL